MDIEYTDLFKKWIFKLRDATSRQRILLRIRRIADTGDLGDFKTVGNGVSEIRINYGPGYRVYFMFRGKQLIVLLCGGDKSSQQSDIQRAKKMAQEA